MKVTVSRKNTNPNDYTEWFKIIFLKFYKKYNK